MIYRLFFTTHSWFLVEFVLQVMFTLIICVFPCPLRSGPVQTTGSGPACATCRLHCMGIQTNYTLIIIIINDICMKLINNQPDVKTKLPSQLYKTAPKQGSYYNSHNLAGRLGEECEIYTTAQHLRIAIGLILYTAWLCQLRTE